jgi:hypothetical protein
VKSAPKSSVSKMDTGEKSEYVCFENVSVVGREQSFKCVSGVFHDAGSTGMLYSNFNTTTAGDGEVGLTVHNTLCKTKNSREKQKKMQGD